MKKALLLSGGVHPQCNHDRYARDLLLYLDGLLQRGWPRSAIRVLHGEGAAVLAVPALQSTEPCTAANVADALTWLADLAPGDFGLLVASNHGNEDGLRLWADEFLSPATLKCHLSTSRGALLLVFGQCHAGIFAHLGLPQTVVACACRADQQSRGRPQRDYDQFLYDFATVLLAHPASGLPTCAQAFDHAARVNPKPDRETAVLDDPFGLAAGLTL